MVIREADYKKEIVEKRRPKRLKPYFEEFMSLNVKCAEVFFDDKDYKSPQVCSMVLGVAAKRHQFPIAVRRIGDQVFLIRKDI